MTLQLPQGFWLDTVDSTMAEARRLVAAGRLRGTGFVVASHQDAGRGTKGRQWVSPPGHGIYLTVVHQPVDSEEKLRLTTDYTLAAGVACVETLKTVTGIETGLKPVNDVYAEGRKLGGILVESDVVPGGISALYTGIGLNTHSSVRLDQNQMPVPAIAIEDLLSPKAFSALSLDLLIETLVAQVCFWHGLVFNQQTGQVDRAWARACLPDFASESIPERIRDIMRHHH